jgi:hypothetical protein
MPAIEALTVTTIASGSIAPSIARDVVPAGAQVAGHAPNTKDHVDGACATHDEGRPCRASELLAPPPRDPQRRAAEIVRRAWSHDRAARRDHARIVQRNRTTNRAFHRGPQSSATTRNRGAS